LKREKEKWKAKGINHRRKMESGKKLNTLDLSELFRNMEKIGFRFRNM
jgi:hypothetical protein